MTAFFRTWTFWIAVCTWLVLMAGHYATIVPPPYGLVLANLVALVYGTLRCLQKRQAGLPWKGILFTSEFGVTSATVLMNLLESLTKLPSLPPKALAVISGGVVALGSLLHTLSSTNTRKVLPPVSEILTSLSKDNLSSGVPDKATSHDETPGVPKSIHNETTEPNLVDKANLTDWYEYSISNEKGKVAKTLCLVPSWSEHEVLSFLAKRGVIETAETSMIRVLQRDEKNAARVFQTIDVAGTTLTFVFTKEMGSWKP
jgi:hypothetical protein